MGVSGSLRWLVAKLSPCLGCLVGVYIGVEEERRTDGVAEAGFGVFLAEEERDLIDALEFRAKVSAYRKWGGLALFNETLDGNMT